MNTRDTRIFSVPLTQVQPSQLYLHAGKLAIEAGTTTQALPVILLDGRLVFTDGHTRAFAAYLAGRLHVNVFLDQDNINRSQYRECVRWCRDDGILWIRHLKDRVVEAEQYKVLWLDRCDAMHKIF